MIALCRRGFFSAASTSCERELECVPPTVKIIPLERRIVALTGTQTVHSKLDVPTATPPPRYEESVIE